MDRQKEFNAGLMGVSLDTGNMGVSALTASLIKIILSIKPHANIELFIGNRSSDPQLLKMSDKTISLDIVNYRLSPKSKISEHIFWIFFLACLQRIIPVNSIRKRIINSNRWLKNLHRCDFIGEICGGDSFSDIYGIRRFVFTVIPDIIAIFLNKPLILLPQTYGPYKSFFAKKIAYFIISRADQIVSRDKEGIDIVKRILKNNKLKKNVYFCPDVAFMLDSILPQKPDIHPAFMNKDISNLIGINVNGLLYHGGYTRDNMFGLKMDYQDFIHKLIMTFLKNTDAQILLVPHTFGVPGNINSDPDACKSILNTLPANYDNRIHMVMKQYNQNEIKGIIGMCNFFVGSRMHACIAALSQFIPTVGVAYSRKFLGVFDSIGLGDGVVDARIYDTDEAIKQILVKHSHKEHYKKILDEKVERAKKQILELFKDNIS